jgi:hypothetical protein
MVELEADDHPPIRGGDHVAGNRDPSTADQGIKPMFLFDGKFLTANVAVIETSDSMGSLLSVECLVGVGDALVGRLQLGLTYRMGGYSIRSARTSAKAGTPA